MTRLRDGYGAAGFVVALAAAIALATFGLMRGTWAVGGSDSSCYGLMAKAFASGHLQPTSALAIDAPWPNAQITFAPGGFISSTLRSDAAAPICAPGMSVLMAPLAAVFGLDAIFWLTPIAAAILVLSAYAIATHLAGAMAGVMAAILIATSPIVLYQTVQPMNDIVTAALWMAAIAVTVRLKADAPLHGDAVRISAGILTGLAIMVRPNLAPLAIVVIVLALMPSQDRVKALATIVAATLPGVIVMLWLNNALYGGPFKSGYGAASQLFSTSHFQANLTNYSRAMFATQNVVPIVGVIAPLFFDGAKRVIASLLLLGAAVVIAIYLLYEPFPEWWYLRFLIPALILLLVLASAGATHVLSRANMGGVIPLLAVVLGALGVRAAASHDVFALQAMEGRYRQTGEVVRDRLPENAVMITEWQSGSIRFHADREVVLWESLDPAWLDRAITWLKSKGLQPYILVERREEPQFRARFKSQSEIGGLDWPPRFDLNRQVRIFDPTDRARYLAGEPYATEQVGYPRRIQSPRKM
jgi:hypothetical protein